MTTKTTKRVARCRVCTAPMHLECYECIVLEVCTSPRCRIVAHRQGLVSGG